MDKEIKEKLHIEKVVNTGRLYPMKEACEQTGLAYETLKFTATSALFPASNGMPGTAASLTTRTFPGSRASHASKTATCPSRK